MNSCSEWVNVVLRLVVSHLALVTQFTPSTTLAHVTCIANIFSVCVCVCVCVCVLLVPRLRFKSLNRATGGRCGPTTSQCYIHSCSTDSYLLWCARYWHYSVYLMTVFMESIIIGSFIIKSLENLKKSCCVSYRTTLPCVMCPIGQLVITTSLFVLQDNHSPVRSRS